jgi:rapamycin-insensitive companion of mTOR
VSKSLIPVTDDFRSALSHASNCIKTLASTARSSMSPNTTSPPSSAGHSTSSGPADIDRTRIEIMNTLVANLQRNLRVRYELNVPELVQA